jgi:hypothetical protein
MSADSSWPKQVQVFPKFLFSLVVVLLVVPHTLMIQQWYLTDNSYIRFDLIALSWVMIRAYGSTIAGPFDTIGLSFPDTLTLLWSALALPASIVVFLAVRRSSQGVSAGRLGVAVIACIVLWVFILGGFTVLGLGFWSQTLIPFPLQQISIAMVARHYYSSRPEGPTT